jgi:hypothetical protein
MITDYVPFRDAAAPLRTQSSGIKAYFLHSAASQALSFNGTLPSAPADLGSPGLSLALGTSPIEVCGHAIAGQDGGLHYCDLKWTA